jgi:hypothetical protein
MINFCRFLNVPTVYDIFLCLARTFKFAFRMVEVQKWDEFSSKVQLQEQDELIL